jgi:ribosomal-protein-alanine N-acetyltransferase
MDLKPANPKDATTVFPEWTAEICQYMITAPPATLADCEAFLAARQADQIQGIALSFTIWEDKEFIGMCSATNLQTERPELDLWIKKSAQGQGHGLKALKALISELKKHHPHDSFIYTVAAPNQASHRLAEKCGGRLSHISTHTLWTGQTWQFWEFAITTKSAF